jgi:hypothetical protein
VVDVDVFREKLILHHWQDLYTIGQEVGLDVENTIVFSCSSINKKNKNKQADALAKTRPAIGRTRETRNLGCRREFLFFFLCLGLPF